MSDAATPTVVQQDVSKYMYQIRKLKDALAASANERNTAMTELAASKAQLADLQTKSDGSALVKRNQELESKIREIGHRKILDKVAILKGVKPEALDAFTKLAEYKFEGEPNEAEITAFVDAKKESLGFLFGDPAKPGDEPPPKKPAVGSGQHRLETVVANGFDLPPKGDARWNDTKWLSKTQDLRAERAKYNEERGILENFGATIPE